MVRLTSPRLNRLREIFVRGYVKFQGKKSEAKGVIRVERLATSLAFVPLVEYIGLREEFLQCVRVIG